jgi:ribosome biogenesis protein Nip4
MNLEEFLKPFGMKKAIDAQLVGRSHFIIKDKQFLGKRPVYSGECIAHIRGPVLIPSIDFLQQIGKEARKQIVVNEKAEWLYICGRDVFAKGIISHNNPMIGDRVVVLNKHKECLGYGDVIAPLDGKRVVIKRLFDIGDLLRRERKSKKVRQQ